MSTNENIEKIFELNKNIITLSNGVKINRKRIKETEKLLKIPVYDFKNFNKGFLRKIQKIIKFDKQNVAEMIIEIYNIKNDLYKIIKTSKHNEKFFLNLLAYTRLYNGDVNDLKNYIQRDWILIENIVCQYEKTICKDFFEINEVNNEERYEKLLKGDTIREYILDTILYLFDNLNNFFDFIEVYDKNIILTSHVIENNFDSDFHGTCFKVPVYFDDNPIWEGEKIVMVDDVEYSFISPTLNWVREKFKDKIKVEDFLFSMKDGDEDENY